MDATDEEPDLEYPALDTPMRLDDEVVGSAMWQTEQQ